VKRRLLKGLVGVSIVLSQLGVLLWIFWMTRSYFTVKEAVDLSASISPVLAISLVLVIKDFLRQKPSASLSSSTVPFELALISFILLAFYVVALVLCCVGFPDHITSVEDLKTYFLGIQSIFGAYLGYVIDVLFYPKAP
jgi:hypothetical protein